MVKQFAVEVQVARSTRDAYERHLGRYLAPWLDDHGLTLEELTWADFLQFVQDKRWSYSTGKQAQSAIRKYLEWLHVEDHPIQQHTLHRQEPEKGYVLTPEDIKKLGMAGSRGSDRYWRNWAMLLVAFHGALRSNELVHLQLGDLDFEGGKVYVRHGKQGRREHAPFPPDGESGGPQPWVKVYLARIRPKYANGTGALFVGINGRTPGEPMTAAGWCRACKQWGRSAGIPQFSPHACRRGFAHYFTRKGVATELVMRAGRWHDYRSFRRYVQDLDVEDFLNAIQTIGNP
jgi:site-specific recombinase XerD